MPNSCLRIPLLLCLTILGARPAWPVNPNTRIAHYGHTAWRASEGTFDSPPTVLAQTGDGYLWIGAASGLTRFDGARFVKLTDAHGVKLPTNTILSLFADRDGSLWIGTGMGLSHLKDGVLTNLTSNIAGVRAIAQDDAGTIWVARANMRVQGSGALCKAVGTSLQCYGAAESFPIPFAKTIACDHQGNIWVGGATSYIRWNPKSQTVYAPDAFKRNMDIAAIGSMAIAPNGHPLIGMMAQGPGLGLEQMVDGKAQPFGPFAGIDPEDVEANAIRPDSHGAVWLGTMNGLIRLYQGVAERFNSSNGLSGENVNDILEDREGDLWVASVDGLDRFRDLPVQSFNQSDNVHGANVHTLLVDRGGQLWFQPSVGLEVLHNGNPITIHSEKGFDNNTYIPLMFQASDGALWMSMGEQLIRYDRGKMQVIARPPDAPPHTQTYGFAEGAGGVIFAMQGPTPDLWRIRNGVATRVVTTPALPPAYEMTGDHDGALWFGLPDGRLARLRGTSLEILSTPHTDVPSFIRQITATADNTVLAATTGLIAYKDGKMEALGKASGLPCDRLIAFTFDLSGNLWMTSTCGLMEVSREDWLRWREDPQAKVTPHVYDALDGVRWTANQVSHAIDVTPDGRLWFATGGPLQMIDPADLAINKIAPTVLIEGVTADSVPEDAGSPIRLPALTHQLQIDYTATSLAVPQRVVFRYKLEGYDKDWQLAGNRRQAFYTSLKPGTYHFTVLACNNSGLWNNIGSNLTFTIAPAWFQTRWFLAFCCLIAALFLYGLYWLRMKQLRSGLQLRYEARLEERTRVARDLHDTLLQTIQGTKLVAEQALQDQNDAAHLHGAIEKIYHWLSRAVVEGRAALTALRSDTNAGDLGEKLRRAAEVCTKGAGTTLRFDVIGTAVNLRANAAEEIFLVGYEAIRNACAHSKATLIEVRLTYGTSLGLTVKDNGIGIGADADRGSTVGHYGLAGMRERATRMGGTLSINSSQGSGTEVNLTVNVKTVLSDI